MSQRSGKFSRSRRVALAGSAAVRAVSAQQAAVPVDETATQLPEDKDVIFWTAGEPLEPEKRREDWLKSVAGKLGISSDRLQSAMQDATKEVGFPGPLLAPPGLMIGTAPTGTFNIRIDPGIAAAAKALGMTEDQLRKEWPAKSLTDLAKARNVDPKVVADALKAQRRADLDKAVAEKKLPADLAERLKSNMDEMIDH